MRSGRRRILQAAAIAPLLARAASSGAKLSHGALRLHRARQSLAGSGYPDTAVWTYGGSVPGPELRVRQGERLTIDVENTLDVDTTVHWHGVRVPNRMDGVPHLTQPPIAGAGGRFTYSFELPDAGTFWYHPHLGNSEQVARGLYGALVVEERKRPAVDRDIVWMLSDWRLDREAAIADDFGSPMDASHAGRIGNTVTVNGVVRDTFDVRAGERIRLRLVNASVARIMRLAFEGHTAVLLAYDGHPRIAQRVERILLGPGMRADVMLDCAANPGSRHRVVDDFYPRQAYRLLDLAYSARPPLRETFDAVPSLSPNPVSVPQLDRAERHRVRFEGGAMGRLPTMQHGVGRAFWSMNGQAEVGGSHRHAPLLTLDRGRTCVLELVNDTAWHHPIHLHGHVFALLARNGQPAPAGEWSDTVLLDPRTSAEIAFVADNPGNWMLHCHVLDHQASGMMAVIRVL